jgi:hypothetical protein
MEMKMVSRLWTLGAFVLCACHTVDGPLAGQCDSFRAALAAEKPATKAARVAKEGTPLYLLAVQGYVLQFPGVSDTYRRPPGLGYKILEGTSDAIEDKTCLLYQREARDYATVFNRKIIEILGVS